MRARRWLVVSALLCVSACSDCGEDAAEETETAEATQPPDPVLPAGELALPFEVTVVGGTEGLSATQRALYEAYRAHVHEDAHNRDERSWGDTEAAASNTALLPNTQIVRVSTWTDAGHNELPLVYMVIRDRRILYPVYRRVHRTGGAEDDTVVEIWPCPPSATGTSIDGCLDLTRELTAAAHDDARIASLEERGPELARIVMTLREESTVMPVSTPEDLPDGVEWEGEPREPGVSTTLEDGVLVVRGLVKKPSMYAAWMETFELRVGRETIDLSTEAVGVKRYPQN